MNKVTYFNSNNFGDNVSMMAMVESSTIQFAYWSNIVEKAGSMVIKFWSGKEYRYKNVSAQTFSTLISADSVGKKFNEIIRGQYEYELKPAE
jgi:hypothetical protein